MTRFVLDASVALAWAFEDEVSPYAAAAVRSLGHDRATAPCIWSVEVGNALNLAVRRARIDELHAYRIHRTLHRLPLDTGQEIADAVLGQRILRLGIDHGMTAYDACYVELAVRRGLPLATQDQRLARAAAISGVEIVQSSDSPPRAAPSAPRVIQSAALEVKIRRRIPSPSTTAVTRRQ